MPDLADREGVEELELGLRGVVEGRTGGTLRILSLGSLDHLDFQRSYYMLAAETFRCTVRTLMTYPGRPSPHPNDLIPDLAADYPAVSADRCTYVFRLRPDARFAPPVDRSVRSRDFKQAFERLLSPDTRGGTHVFLADIVGAADVVAGRRRNLAGVECPDDATLVIHLERPLTDFLNVLALAPTGPVPPEVLKDDLTREIGHLTATGPYRVETYEPERLLRLVRNPCWDAASDPSRAAWPDAVELRLNTEWDEILQAIEEDRADLPAVVNPEPRFIRRYSGDAAFAGRWHVGPTNCGRYINLNTRVPPFDDVRVRQAFNCAVDKVALREVKGGELAGRIATAILPPTLHGHHQYDLYPSLDHRGDLDRARALLADAGHAGGFSTWAAVTDVGYGPGVGHALRDALQRVGIEVEIREIPLSRYVATIGDPDARVPIAASVGWCADWPGHGARTFMRPFFHTDSIRGPGTTNFSFYENPEVDALIDRAELAEPTDAARLWAEIDERIMRDAPCVPWLYDNHYDLVSARVRNFYLSSFLVGADWPNLWLEGGD